MSDTSGGESGGVSKKKSFSSRLSRKLHNPFKRGGTSDSSTDDEAEKSPNRVTRKKTVKAAVAHLIPPIPGNLSLSPGRGKDSAKPAPLQQAPEGGVPPTAALAQPSKLAAAAPASSTATAAAAAASGGAQAPAVPGRPAVPAKPVVPERPAVAATPVQAVTEVGGPVAKRRDVVGGAVHGVAEIVLTGVKGDPDVAMKTLRARGFVVHLVRWNGRE